MSAPYLDHLAAIRAALNVDARSLYQPASWQKHAGRGYRELHLPPPGDLSRLERFEQDCLTYAFLNDRLPPVQWAVIIVRHSLRITDPQEQRAELDRLRWAVWTAAGQVPCDDVALARWGVMRWGGKLAKTDTWQSRWGGGKWRYRRSSDTTASGWRGRWMTCSQRPSVTPVGSCLTPD